MFICYYVAVDLHINLLVFGSIDASLHIHKDNYSILDHVICCWLHSYGYLFAYS